MLRYDVKAPYRLLLDSLPHLIRCKYLCDIGLHPLELALHPAATSVSIANSIGLSTVASVYI